MDIFKNNDTARAGVVTSLAVVGFVTLIGFGIWSAVYSTRFVPGIVNTISSAAVYSADRIGSAAVYLGSVFTPASEPSLSVVPTASTTIPFGEATTTATSAEPVAATTSKPVVPTAGTPTTSTTQIGGSVSGTTPLSGLPDLLVTINKVGYLATTSASSFVASSTIPAGSRPAVTFTIKNIGTNATGAWYFSASIPTQTAYVYQSQAQQNLNPGDSIEYTLGFDQATQGAGKIITITANYNHAIAESISTNSVASTTVTILGN